MPRRATAKPEATTPVVASEEQAKIDATKTADAEAAKAAEAEAAAKAGEAQKAAEPAKPAAEKAPKHRFEKFERERPDGTLVVVERNIDTGEQTVTEK